MEARVERCVPGGDGCSTRAGIPPERGGDVAAEVTVTTMSRAENACEVLPPSPRPAAAVVGHPLPRRDHRAVLPARARARRPGAVARGRCADLARVPRADHGGLRTRSACVAALLRVHRE